MLWDRFDVGDDETQPNVTPADYGQFPPVFIPSPPPRDDPKRGEYHTNHLTASKHQDFQSSRLFFHIRVNQKMLEQVFPSPQFHFCSERAERSHSKAKKWG
jgi:hypothetical protein